VRKNVEANPCGVASPAIPTVGHASHVTLHLLVWHATMLARVSLSKSIFLAWLKLGDVFVLRRQAYT
jgi:hypothetical protein